MYTYRYVYIQNRLNCTTFKKQIHKNFAFRIAIKDPLWEKHRKHRFITWCFIVRLRIKGLGVVGVSANLFFTLSVILRSLVYLIIGLPLA